MAPRGIAFACDAAAHMLTTMARTKAKIPYAPAPARLRLAHMALERRSGSIGYGYVTQYDGASCVAAWTPVASPRFLFTRCSSCQALDGFAPAVLSLLAIRPPTVMNTRAASCNRTSRFDFSSSNALRRHVPRPSIELGGSCATRAIAPGAFG